MKRMLSMLLALAMVLSLMAGMCFTVSAESTVITEVWLEGEIPPEAVVGGTAQIFVWTVPTDAGYNLAWGGEVDYYNLSEGRDLEEGEPFGFGDYLIQAALDANEGYIFDPNVQVYLGDVLLTDAGFEVEVANSDTVWLTRSDVVEPEYIEGAFVTGTPIPQLQIGDTLPELSYSVPEGADYTVEAYWEENYVTVPAGTVVEDGNDYTLYINVYANEGYAFSYDFPLVINGEEYRFQPINGLGEGFEYCHFSREYPFLTPIDKVEFSYDEPVVGQPLSDVTIAEGALYTADMDWYDCNENTWIEPGAVAEIGNRYRGEIDAYPVEGYMFTGDTEIWVNGERITEDFECYLNVNYDHIGVNTREYDFTEAVAEAYVTYTEPVAGQPLPMPVAGTGNYAVDEVATEWYDYTTGQWVRPGTVAEKGHSYYLDLWVMPAEDYGFTEDTKLYVNGVLVEYYEGVGGRIVWNSEDYNFCDLVTKVELTYAEPELGQVLPTPTVSGEGVFLAEWNWYDYYTEEVAPQGAVAEKGHIYTLGAYIEAEEGYYFSEDTRFFLNGVELRMGYDVGFDQRTIYFYSDDHSFAEKLHSASFTIADLVVGQSFPQAVAPAGVNYEVVTYWYDTLTDEEATGTVQANGSYELEVEIYTDAGYEFAKDATLTVNGKEASYREFYLYTDEMLYHKHYSFLTPVAKVELPAIPELKLGDTLPEIYGSGNGYIYIVAALGYDAEGNKLTGNTVVEGGLYEVVVEVAALEGYEFTEDTVFTLGGKEPSAFAEYAYTYFIDYKIFSFGDVKTINEVEINTTIPTIGRRGGEVTAAGEDYYLEYYSWGVAPGGDLEKADEATKPYQAGDHVLLELELCANDTSYFDSDLTVNINGKTYTPVGVFGNPAYMYVVIDLGEAQEGPKYNGLVVVDGVWGYYEGGIFQEDYTGLVPYGDLIFYVENGILDFTYTGLAWYNNAWTYVANSQLTQGYTGLVWFEGEWFYVVDSVIDWTFTGLVPYEGNYFYVQNNHLDWSYTSLGYHDGGWYFIQNGLFQKEYSGLVYFNDNWFYVEEGVLTYQFFGMVEYEGNLFYVQASHLDWSYTGLGYHEGAWYYFQNALYTPSFTGLVPFNGSLFYVKDGTIDWSFNGSAEYDGTTYTVVNGAVEL